MKKPVSVTIFGILNIILGGFGLFFGSIVVLHIVYEGSDRGVEPKYLKFLLAMNVIGVAFSIWLAILGIGLLSMREWARRGSIIYGWLGIIFFVVEMSVNFTAMAFGWFRIPEGGMEDFIIGMVISTLGGLVYPVLLLIFMKTEKVKRVFAAIGG